jgi:hypothetical protein
MLAIVATVGWILFDVYFCLRTAPDNMSAPVWWTLLIGGVGLGVVALIGELWDRRSHQKEINGLNAKLDGVREGQTFQAGQLNAAIQLIGQDAVKKIAEELRIPITEVAKNFVEGIRDTFTQEATMRDENKLLRERIKWLEEHPERIGTIAVIQETPAYPRVAALNAAMRSASSLTGSLTVKKPDGTER